MEYTAGQPYVGATLTMYPTPGQSRRHGQLHRVGCGSRQDRLVEAGTFLGVVGRADDRRRRGRSTARWKVISRQSRRRTARSCWKFKTPSGIIGNVFTYEHGGKQYVGVYSGIGGWAGIGMAAGLTESTEGLGAVGGYKDLAKYTTLGGSLFIFGLPDSTGSATTALK